jgi:uncharacterized coiled-coil protein SlyX
MPFLAPAIGAIGTAIAGAASFVGSLGAIGQLAIGLGLSLVRAAFTKKPDAAPTGTKLDVQYGADLAREIGLGLFAVAGHDVFTNTSGKSNKFISKVFVLSDFRIDGLERIAVNGAYVTLGAETERGQEVMGDVYDALWVRIYKGLPGQAADPYLISTSNPAGRWTADHRLAGIAYAVVTAKWDDEKMNSFPQILFECRGAPLYDIRRDSTAGGSGSHRWDDQSTWEYGSNIGPNPIIQAYCYERGFTVNGELIIGKGMPASDLPAAAWMAAMNVCDEIVDGAPRYRSGCLVTAADGISHRDNLEPILQTAAAALVERVDGDQPLVGANQPVVATLTDADLIIGASSTFQAKRSRSELVNGVFGSFNSPEDLWSATAYPPKSDVGALAADRERHAAQLDFAAVYDKGQAIRLADIAVRENRYQASATITVRPRWIAIEAGDWIRWNSARRGNRIYRVTSRTLAPLNEQGARNVTLSLQEVGTGIYDSSILIPEMTPRAPMAAPDFLGTVENFLLIASSVIATSGRSYPAFEARWDVIDDVTVNAVLVEYWKTSDPTVRLQKSFQMPAVYGTIAEGVLPVTGYTARARIITNPVRDTLWSREWSATSLPEDLVFDAAQLANEVNQVIIRGQESQSALEALIDGLAANVSSTAIHLQLESSRLNSEAFRLDSEVTKVGARLISEQFLRETGDEVVAAAVTRAEARLDALNTGQTGQAVALESLTSRVTNTENGIEAVAESVEGVRSAVEDPATGLLAQGQAINILQSQSGPALSGGLMVTAMSVAELQATLDVVAANATAAQAGALQTIRIASARTFQIDEASVARDEAAASRISGAESRLTSAESRITGQATAMQTLTTRVTNTEGAIASTASAVTSAQSRLDDVEGVNSGQATAISSLGTTVTSQGNTITSQGNTISAQALAISGVQAQVGNLAASGLISFAVVAGGTSSFSRIAILAKASAGDTFKESGIYIETTPSASTVVIRADRFAITDGSTSAIPFVVEGGVVKFNIAYFQQFVSMNGKMLLDGTGGKLIIRGD